MLNCFKEELPLKTRLFVFKQAQSNFQEFTIYGWRCEEEDAKKRDKIEGWV